MSKSWTTQVNQRDRDRRSIQAARVRRARAARAEARRQAIEHPVGTLFRKLLGG